MHFFFGGPFLYLIVIPFWKRSCYVLSLYKVKRIGITLCRRTLSEVQLGIVIRLFLKKNFLIKSEFCFENL